MVPRQPRPAVTDLGEERHSLLQDAGQRSGKAFDSAFKFDKHHPQLSSRTMLRRDPISSSPAPEDNSTRLDFGTDDIARGFTTQPTMPVNRAYITQPTLPIPGIRSPYVAVPTTALGPTQPTQLLSTPKPQRIQVPRSSPPSGRYLSPDAPSQSMHFSQTPQRTMMHPMIPPGCQGIYPRPAPRPVAIDLTSDDGPVEADSQEEDTTRSNIKPSPFENSSRATRVAETPQKRAFDMSRFTHDPSRKRPAKSSPPAPPRNKIRQVGPSRAVPVSEQMAIEDIQNVMVQTNVKRLLFLAPKRSVQDVYNILKSKGFNYTDAADFITDSLESSDDELAPTPQVVQQTKKTAEATLAKQRRSITDKFSTLKRASADDVVHPPESPQPRRRGRLVRGRRNPSPEAAPSPQKSVADKDEAIMITSDSEVENQDSEEDVPMDDGFLEYFNTCTVEAMADLSGLKDEDIRKVFDERPFKSTAEIEKIRIDVPGQVKHPKARRPKVPFGQRLVEHASTMWNGYRAVDNLVEQCKARGRPISAAISKWGINISGTTKDGEVAITNLDDASDAGSMRDSGYATPRSSNSSDPESEISKKKSSIARGSSRKPRLLQKPSIMSAELELKDYQVVGLNWLSMLWANGISGILADDMGLGKTCQVIAFISHLKEQEVKQDIKGPHLVIVPGSTLENWLREFQRFSPDLTVEPYYGSQPARFAQQDRILDDLRGRKTIDVIVTTYDLAFKKEDNSFLRKCKPEACIFDEGHILKNSKTMRYKMLMRIPARCRFLLTGTPLQNSLQELMSILAFIMPDVFTADVDEDLAAVFKHKAKVTEKDTHGSLLSSQRIQRARSMLTPFILRRKKDQVLKHLPKKTCRVEYCDLTEKQTRIYKQQLERQRLVLLDRSAGKQVKDHANVMMKLRQAAIHPLLFRDYYNDDIIRELATACVDDPAFETSDPDVIFEELQLYQDYQCHQLAEKYHKTLGHFMLQNEEWLDSGKVHKLVELLLKFKKNGDRTLVFSQFTSVMDILAWALTSHDIRFFRLDGQTPISVRQDMFDQFYEDESIPVFMLSTKSGGAGINLACANKVIIFDSSFNPQDDVQAENRAHRVGQEREVEVVRLVTKGTVEEQIHALGISKLELDKMVAGEEAAEAAEADTKGKKGKKAQEPANKLSAAETMGMKAVEDMLMKDFDVKDQFLNGLKNAGLDMSAAK
ncbi:hypothetical protein EJ04DRAFT_549401 [Polyplosphaeria fusca]|uniref:DNA helicase n=1 Tax=Polyplosphaeria fusca TaxID=682080 RepID=A0A9P4R9E7_9PLEO|nr:hypothetical protein EJ04DRAFT_549401 [Polyplosphaeria fusca]